MLLYWFSGAPPFSYLLSSFFFFLLLSLPSLGARYLQQFHMEAAQILQDEEQIDEAIKNYKRAAGLFKVEVRGFPCWYHS